MEPAWSLPIAAADHAAVNTALSAAFADRRERASKRRRLLCQQLDTADLGRTLGIGATAAATKAPLAQPQLFALESVTAGPRGGASTTGQPDGDSDAGDDELMPAFDPSYAAEGTYTGSSVFLKGLHSANPHLDYQQHFVNSGERPQNMIVDPPYAERYEDAPKLQQLNRLKDRLFQHRVTAPMYLAVNPSAGALAAKLDLPGFFDVILLDPPLLDYAERAPGIVLPVRPLSWDAIGSLDIPALAAPSAFLFMWVGSGTGLSEGRRCFEKWGFQRVEDICWVKTNRRNPGNTTTLGPGAVLQHTKEHCLVGKRGSVQRSVDGNFVHTNVDVDVIVDEEPDYGSTAKPEELFRVIEHFCLGRRRLHIFASDADIRPGWLSVGPEISSSNFDSVAYRRLFDGPAPAVVDGQSTQLASHDNTLVGTWPEIDHLRYRASDDKVFGGGANNRR